MNIIKKHEIAQVEKNQVVRSKSGRDKKRFFVVLKVEEDFVYLVDGKLRKLEKPKKKKIIHISLTKSFIPLDGLSDKAIYKSLAFFNENQ